jgi:hypothetical protein
VINKTSVTALAVNQDDGRAVFKFNTATTTSAAQAPLEIIDRRLTSFRGGITLTRAGSSAITTGVEIHKYGGTIDAPTAVSSGDEIGGLYASGYDGTNFDDVGRIIVDMHSLTGANDSQGSMWFGIMGETGGNGSITTPLMLRPFGNVMINPSDTTSNNPGADAVGNIIIENGTAPSASPANTVSMWTADYAAGDSRLYVQSEASTKKLILGNGLVSYNSGDFQTTSHTPSRATHNWTATFDMPDDAMNQNCTVSSLDCIIMPGATNVGRLIIYSGTEIGEFLISNTGVATTVGSLTANMENQSGAGNQTNCTDTKLCIFDNGSNVGILNNLGSIATTTFVMTYD